MIKVIKHKLQKLAPLTFKDLLIPSFYHTEDGHKLRLKVSDNYCIVFHEQDNAGPEKVEAKSHKRIVLVENVNLNAWVSEPNM